MAHVYTTAMAFRTALEHRLKKEAGDAHTDIMRLRRQVAFDRFLGRLFTEPDSPWLLKGGYACELRLGGRARSTKDIDLTLPYQHAAGADDPAEAVRELLQDAAEKDMRDWFEFQIARAREQLAAPPYGGARYSVTANVASREFCTFQMDISFAGLTPTRPEWLQGHDWLAFAGIEAPRIAALPVPQQFAEKVHAYSLPYKGRQENSRVKDLADMILYLETRSPDPVAVAQAIRATFDLRNTHSIPATLQAPPQTWSAEYVDIAARCGDSPFAIIARW